MHTNAFLQSLRNCAPMSFRRLSHAEMIKCPTPSTRDPIPRKPGKTLNMIQKINQRMKNQRIKCGLLRFLHSRFSDLTQASQPMLQKACLKSLRPIQSWSNSSANENRLCLHICANIFVCVHVYVCLYNNEHIYV